MTDESYYEHPAPKPVTKSQATATDPVQVLEVDAANANGKGVGPGGAAAGKGRVNYAALPFLDLLSHEVYVQVLQTAGAVPKGRAFRDMSEEAARECIAAWYKRTVAGKLRDENRTQSPEVRAERKLSRKQTKFNSKQSLLEANASTDKLSEKLSAANAYGAEAPGEKDKNRFADMLSDSSEGETEEAAQLVATAGGKKAIGLVQEELVARVRAMRAKIAPGIDVLARDSSDHKLQS
jgi:hypothetical protein